jgi:hypothetical protein
MALLIPALPTAYELLLTHLWMYSEVMELGHCAQPPTPRQLTALGLAT